MPKTPSSPTCEPVRVVTVDHRSRATTFTTQVGDILADLDGDLASAMWQLLVDALTSGRSEEDADDYPRRTFLVAAPARAATAQELRDQRARLLRDDATLAPDDLPEPPCGLAAFIVARQADEDRVYTEVTRLYEAANDSEAALLDDLRVRAGIVWECYGRTGGCSCWTNPADSAVCEHCGAPRELASVEEHRRPIPPAALLTGESALAASSGSQRAAFDLLCSKERNAALVALLTDGNLAVSLDPATVASPSVLFAPDGQQIRGDSE
jgi:hypothetical protein